MKRVTALQFPSCKVSKHDNDEKKLCSSQVEFTPDLVHRFDGEIEVNILGWKTISLRLGGTVEQPCVDVDVVSRSFYLSLDFSIHT